MQQLNGSNGYLKYALFTLAVIVVWYGLSRSGLVIVAQTGDAQQTPTPGELFLPFVRGDAATNPPMTPTPIIPSTR